MELFSVDGCDVGVICRSTGERALCSKLRVGVLSFFVSMDWNAEKVALVFSVGVLSFSVSMDWNAEKVALVLADLGVPIAQALSG